MKFRHGVGRKSEDQKGRQKIEEKFTYESCKLKSWICIIRYTLWGKEGLTGILGQGVTQACSGSDEKATAGCVLPFITLEVSSLLTEDDEIGMSAVSVYYRC